jgi:glycosyltransferase involved in cell wall biosynthesis
VKVLINAASAGLGGALTYIANVLRELPGAAAPGDRFFVVVPSSALGSLDSIIDEERVELIPYLPRQSNGLRRLYFDNRTIPQIARERKADALFSFTGFGTLRCPCPQILLVHNAAYFCPVFQRKYKEINASLHSTRLRRWLSLLSIHAADVVMFPSEAMRQLVALHISIAKKRTVVLHHGFSSHSFFQNGAAKPEIADKMEKWRSEGYKILLNVSHYAVHKNFETLIEALPLVVASGMRIKLVCTLSDRLLDGGSLYARQYKSLLARQRELGIPEAVVHAGHFNYDQLHNLYERADVFVFPSFTESFGLPLVEAMSCGLPVVASDTPVNREICGEAARYFDTFDAAGCAIALKETLRDADMRAAMKTRALERSKDFSWTRHTASLLALCRSLCV